MAIFGRRQAMAACSLPPFCNFRPAAGNGWIGPDAHTDRARRKLRLRSARPKDVAGQPLSARRFASADARRPCSAISAMGAAPAIRASLPPLTTPPAA